MTVVSWSTSVICNFPLESQLWTLSAIFSSRRSRLTVQLKRFLSLFFCQALTFYSQHSKHCRLTFTVSSSWLLHAAWKEQQLSARSVCRVHISNPKYQPPSSRDLMQWPWPKKVHPPCGKLGIFFLQKNSLTGHQSWNLYTVCESIQKKKKKLLTFNNSLDGSTLSRFLFALKVSLK